MLRLRTSTCLSAPAQRLLAMFFICLLAACDRLGAQITDTELNPQNPLGFSWDGVDAQMLANPGRSRTQCEELVFDIEQIFGGRASAAIEQCAKEKTEEIFLTPEILPSSLRWGGVSVMMRGEIEPISYAYSYLHRIYPDYTLQDRGRRAFHAWKIDRKLRKSLGPPLAFGRFDEDSALDLNGMPNELAPANSGFPGMWGSRFVSSVSFMRMASSCRCRLHGLTALHSARN